MMAPSRAEVKLSGWHEKVLVEKPDSDAWPLSAKKAYRICGRSCLPPISNLKLLGHQEPNEHCQAGLIELKPGTVV